MSQKWHSTNQPHGRKMGLRSKAAVRQARSAPSRVGSEDVLEAVQKRLDENPHAMRTRSEQPFGTIKMRMGATHFQTKTLPKVATEMALCVLTSNLTRVLNIVGVPAVLEAIKGIGAGTHMVTPTRCA